MHDLLDVQWNLFFADRADVCVRDVLHHLLFAPEGLPVPELVAVLMPGVCRSRLAESRPDLYTRTKVQLCSRQHSRTKGSRLTFLM
jgi:hypothetical protein